MKLFSVLTLVLVGTLGASAADIDVTIVGGKQDVTNAVVTIPLPADVDASALKSGVAFLTADGTKLVGQISKPGLFSDAKTAEATVVVPELKAGQKLPIKIRIGGEATKPAFEWGTVNGLELLSHYNKPLLQYFHKPYDAKATPAKAPTGNPTTKPFHHLYAPDGKTILTNTNEGQYPHHRGIYWGFNKVSYDGKTADIWHCRNGEHTAHEKVLDTAAGDLFGRHKLLINWIGQDGKQFATENREVTVFNMPGGKLIEFDSLVSTPFDKVRLDGDPQHAGFHFRANSQMETNPKETFFIRPDGKGKPGEERNWTAKGGGPVNLSWNAMSFMLDGKRYTAVYLDHPDNPKEARQSERAYGRIGTYFEYDLTKEKPLKVRYRLWVQEGEPTPEQCAALSSAFANTVSAK